MAKSVKRHAHMEQNGVPCLKWGGWARLLRVEDERLIGARSVAEHKIVIVGLDNAGKTTILYQFLMNEVVHTSPTIGSNVEEVVWKNIRFIMWDLGGQQSLRAAWSTYYSNTEVSFFFSSTSLFSFLLIFSFSFLLIFFLVNFVSLLEKTVPLFQTSRRF